MSNGAEQFLGRQLVNMTQALQGLVNENTEMLLAMQQMKTAIEQTIPKHSVASDTVQKNIPKRGLLYGYPHYYPIHTIVPYLTGLIRLKLKGSAPVTSVVVEMVVDGIVTNTLTMSTIKDVKTIDISVEYGKPILLRVKSGDSNSKVNIEYLDICYDLINRPDITV